MDIERLQTLVADLQEADDFGQFAQDMTPCRVTVGKVRELLSMIDALALNALVADANRYRAVCALVCETDKVKQARILEAVDKFELIDGLANLSPTPELFAGFVDAFVAAIQAARDADS